MNQAPPFAESAPRRRHLRRVAAVVFLGVFLMAAMWNRLSPRRGQARVPQTQTTVPKSSNPLARSFKVGDDDVVQIQLLAGGSALACTLSGAALVLDPSRPRSGRAVQLVPGLTSLASLRSGALIYGDRDGVVWMAKAPGSPSRKVARFREGPVSRLALSADERLVAASNFKGDVQVWEFAGWQQVGRFELGYAAEFLDFLDSATLLAVTSGAQVQRYTVAGRRQSSYDLSAGTIAGAALSPDRRHLGVITGQFFGTRPSLLLLDLSARPHENVILEELDPGVPAFSADGKLLAFCDQRRAGFYSFATRKSRSQPLSGKVMCTSLAVMPDANPDHPVLLIGRTDGQLLSVPF